MEKVKIRLEIYEGDPFGGACCGPGPQVSSLADVEKLRKMLQQRSEIVKRLSEEYKDSATIKRDTINQKRWDYPEYVMKLMLDSKPLPYIFINEKPAIVGKFPTHEEFTTLMTAYMRSEQKQDQ